jgi:hypothetical protein
MMTFRATCKMISAVTAYAVGRIGAEEYADRMNAARILSGRAPVYPRHRRRFR